MFYQSFIDFLKFPFNFELFKKKDESHGLCISEIIDCGIRTDSNESCFSTP